MSNIKTDNTQTILNAVAEIERLQGRVAMLEEFVADAQQHAWRALDPDYVPPAVESAMKSLLHRAATITQEIDPDDVEPGAWLLRKQAEAVEVMADFHDEDCGYLECLRDDDLKEFAGDCVREMSTDDMRDYAQQLRKQASELEAGGGE